MNKYILEITVFICGAIVMVLEIIGSRLLAPIIGTSIIAWTSIIGIILTFLSLGYWLGGMWADKYPQKRHLAAIIFISGLLIAFVTASYQIFEILIGFWKSNLYFTSIIFSVYVFSVPSFLLGTVSPYAAKLQLSDMSLSGVTVGKLYAISTLGSIVGTFLSGFVLIPLWGSHVILYVSSSILILLSILLSLSRIKTKITLVLLILSIASISKWSRQFDFNYWDIETRYNRVQISDRIDLKNHKKIRIMTTDRYGQQSGMYLEHPSELTMDYLKYFQLARHFSPDLDNTLIIGAAAYNFPNFYLQKYPQAKIDVVELDPGMTEIARNFFGLKDNRRMRIIHEDGRIYLNNNIKKYDAILVDAYRSSYAIPFQLTTEEAVTKIYNSLDKDGVVMVNIISSITGDKSDFLHAEAATYKKIFPQVYVFQVDDKRSADVGQNIILVALKSDQPAKFNDVDSELNLYLHTLRDRDNFLDKPVLTDDHAPVEYYIMKLM